MTIDLDKLKAAAEAATPGPWLHEEHGSKIVNSNKGSQQILVATVAVCTYKDWGRHNATFIAAANPAVVLELIKRAEEAEAALEQVRVQLAGCGVAALQNTEKSKRDRISRGAYGWSASYDAVCEAVDREIELRAELAAAQKDAERYRWLRADSRPAAWRLEYWVGYWECSTFGDDLDAAIDKAMEAK